MADIREIIADRLTKAQRELQQAELRVRELKWRIEEYRTLLGHNNSIENRELNRIHGTKDSPNEEKPFTQMTANDVIQHLLRSSSQPLRIVDLARRAIDGGYGGPGAVVSKIVPNFSSVVSRSLKSPESPFVKVRRGLVDLRQRSDSPEH